MHFRTHLIISPQILFLVFALYLAVTSGLSTNVLKDIENDYIY